VFRVQKRSWKGKKLITRGEVKKIQIQGRAFAEKKITGENRQKGKEIESQSEGNVHKNAMKEKGGGDFSRRALNPYRQGGWKRRAHKEGDSKCTSKRQGPKAGKCVPGRPFEKKKK